MAGRNPQKLRQIGMNYDIANAKGIVELTDEEKKKIEEKKKAAQEKKRKAKEDAEKEKAEFEAWKKEKKEREEKEAKEAKEGKEDKDPKDDQEAKDDKDDKEATEAKEDKSSVEVKVEVDTEATPEANKSESKDEEDQSKASAKGIPSSDKPRDGLSAVPPAPGSVYSAPPSPLLGPVGAEGRLDYAASDAGQPAKASADAEKPVEKQKEWNAVCVLGLRVYSQDPEVSIKLVKPKDPEEGAVLDADGATQAGATM